MIELLKERIKLDEDWIRILERRVDSNFYHQTAMRDLLSEKVDWINDGLDGRVERFAQLMTLKQLAAFIKAQDQLRQMSDEAIKEMFKKSTDQP